MTIVRVYILDEDDEATWLRRQRPSRDQAVRRVNAVDPDHRVTHGYLGVDRSTMRISIESSSLESENIHEEPLSGLHVLVHS